MTEHGVGDYVVAAKYQLGYVADPLPGDERFTGMLAIPYIGPTFDCLAIKYRNIAGGKPKYSAPHGQKPRLFNSNAYFDSDAVVGVTEGEMDAIAATERMGIPSFGVPGVDTWTKMEQVWSPIFKDFLHVLVFAHGDEPGQRMAHEVAEAVGWRARIVQCPEGEDVASMIHAGRIEELRAKCQLAKTS